jgi:hypothetical protein
MVVQRPIARSGARRSLPSGVREIRTSSRSLSSVKPPTDLEAAVSRSFKNIICQFDIESDADDPVVIFAQAAVLVIVARSYCDVALTPESRH